MHWVVKVLPSKRWLSKKLLSGKNPGLGIWGKLLDSQLYRLLAGKPWAIHFAFLSLLFLPHLGRGCTWNHPVNCEALKKSQEIHKISGVLYFALFLPLPHNLPSIITDDSISSWSGPVSQLPNYPVSLKGRDYIMCLFWIPTMPSTAVDTLQCPKTDFLRASYYQEWITKSSTELHRN